MFNYQRVTYYKKNDKNIIKPKIFDLKNTIRIIKATNS